MAIFRWTKYSHIFEYNGDRFTLLPANKEFWKKIAKFLVTPTSPQNIFFFTVEISLYIYKCNVYAFFFLISRYL